MDLNEENPATPVAPRPNYVPVYPAPGPPAKSPLLAAFFSFVMPALGHVYVGVYQRAMVIFVVWVAVFSSAVQGEGREIGILVPIVVFIWLFNIFDAYRQATFAVWGEPEEIRSVTRERGKSGLTFGIALFALGLYGLLRQFFEIDLTFLLDHWYLVVMAVGGWMIWQAITAAKASAEGSAE